MTSTSETSTASTPKEYPYVVVRAIFKHVFCRSLFRGSIPDADIAVIIPPEFTNEEAADRLIEIALEMKEKSNA